MSEVRLVVRDARRDISGTLHGSIADRLVAALSAEPETIEELETALERFCCPRDSGSLFGCFRGGVDDKPYDAGLTSPCWDAAISSPTRCRVWHECARPGSTRRTRS